MLTFDHVTPALARSLPRVIILEYTNKKQLLTKNRQARFYVT